MKDKTKLIITWMFTLCVCVLCANYIIKYQDTEKTLITTQNELRIAQNSFMEQIELNNGLRQRLEQAKKAEETVQTLKTPEYKFVYLGSYKLTAYCSCEICCEGYALNRPTDENGKPIVYTASGTIAKEGRTIGVNPNTIPYGTQVYISGLGWRTAEDTGGGISAKHIDVYMGSHETALNSGLTYDDVWVLVQK